MLQTTALWLTHAFESWLSLKFSAGVGCSEYILHGFHKAEKNPSGKHKCENVFLFINRANYLIKWTS